jgi:outer membrane receptor for ferrienterochelin and colicins
VLLQEQEHDEEETEEIVVQATDAWETSATFFASNLSDTIRLEPVVTAGGVQRVRLIHVDGTTRTRGSELLLRYRKDHITVTGSYVLTDATEPARTRTGRDEVPLTPRHAAGIVAMWEKHGKGRVGVEAYYAGKQRIDDNPYRTESRSYVELGLLGEIVLLPQMALSLTGYSRPVLIARAFDSAARSARIRSLTLFPRFC